MATASLEPAAPARAGLTAAAMLAIVAVFYAQFAWVKPTNFGGFDEWGILSSVARGDPGTPQANRPLQLLWSLPARLGPASVWTYYALHTGYLAGLGCLAYLLARRLTPDFLVAFLTGVFTVTWAPQDYRRLNVFMAYAGLTFSAYLALVLLVESWHRRLSALLMLGALVAFLSLRGFEASVGLLVAAPLVLLPWTQGDERPWRWTLAWEAVVLLAALLAAIPLLFPSRALAYQMQVLGGVDLSPLGVVDRLLEEYRSHLLPLFTSAPRELAAPAVAVVTAVFAAAFVALAHTRAGRDCPAPAGGRGYAHLAGLGVVLAGLGYSVLALTSASTGGGRTQFLAAPAIGLLLAASCAWLASRAPLRWRRPLLGSLAAFVVAVGTGRTLAMQAGWDQISLHADQTRLLRELTEAAPHFRPNTFVLLVDEASVFAAAFTFRHALEYLYPAEAVGHVWGKWDIFYPVRFTERGIVCEPWRELREQAPVTFHRFDETVVFHQPRTGPLRLVARWPEGVLPPLPAAASYDPLSRIVPGPPTPERRFLGRLERVAAP